MVVDDKDNQPTSERNNERQKISDTKYLQCVRVCTALCAGVRGARWRGECLEWGVRDMPLRAKIIKRML